MTEPALEVEDLSAGYGSRPVLRGVSFTVDAGPVLRARPNGGGKTPCSGADGELDAMTGERRWRGDRLVAQTERPTRCP